MKKIILIAAVATIAVACAKKEDNAATPTASVFDANSVQNSREVSFGAALEFSKEERNQPPLTLLTATAKKTVTASFRGVTRIASANHNLSTGETSMMTMNDDVYLAMNLRESMRFVRPVFCTNAVRIKPEYAAPRPRAGQYFLGSLHLSPGRAPVNSITEIKYSSQFLIECEDGTEGKGFERYTKTFVPRLVPAIGEQLVKNRLEIIIDGVVVETVEAALSEIQAN